jgi:hypothetical protein
MHMMVVYYRPNIMTEEKSTSNSSKSGSKGSWKSNSYGNGAPKSNIVKTWGIYGKKNAGTDKGAEPFKLSRTKIDMFLECPLCFYLDRKLGIARPSMPTFTLNLAVDHLLKKEFDIHRANDECHPLMQTYGIDAVPFAHPKMDEWRENFVGVQHLHAATNFLVFGAVDDIWQNNDGKPNPLAEYPQNPLARKLAENCNGQSGSLSIVDYKATSKDGEIVLEDTRWHNQYRRQMEIYQWLLRNNGFTVSDMGYFVYVNGKKDRQAFDGKLEFDVKIIPYEGKSDWIDDVLVRAKKCLDSDEVPAKSPTCEHCEYRLEARKAYERHVKGAKGLV